MHWGNQPQHTSYRSYGPPDATQPVPVMTNATAPAPKRRHRAPRWTAGLAAAAVLAAGGTVAGLDLASSGSAAGGQAAALSAATSPTRGGTASSGKVAGAGARRVAWILRRPRGVHGELTVRAADGGFRELAFERGIIVAVSATDVTVRAADGTAWGWTLMSNTVVRKDGARASGSSLATGDPVLVGGPEHGAVRGARLIIVRKKDAAGQPGWQQGGFPGPSPS